MNAASRFMLVVLSPLLWAALSVNGAAPAPPEVNPEPPPGVVAGNYTMVWGLTECPLALTNKSQSHVYMGGVYDGTWHYDAGSRTLYITEQKDGDGRYVSWHVILNNDLSGLSDGHYKVAVSLRRKPKGE